MTKDPSQNSIRQEIEQGRRVACEDECCTGIIDANGTCKTCGKSIDLERLQQIEMMKSILSIAEQRGEDVTEMLRALEFNDDVIEALIKLSQELRVTKFTEELCKNIKKDDSAKKTAQVKLKNHSGFKRVSIVITFLSFIAPFIACIATIKGDDELIFCVIIPVLYSALVYLTIRIIYWVIDGFIKEKSA